MNAKQQILGPYHLQQRLGSDQIYEVWKAYDTREQRFVVVTILSLKPLDSEIISRFLYETKNLTTLHHPYIAQIFDVFVSPQPNSISNYAAIVIEYIDGLSLATYMNKTSYVGQYPSAIELFHIVAPVAAALDAAHQHGVIHGRIKPSNIIFAKRSATEDERGDPLLVGFGLHNMQAPLDLSLDDVHYISPELAQGHTENTRSDLYSLGVILYEMFTGTLPFNGETPADVMMQHIHMIPISPALINPRVLPPLTAVIMRCLAKDPSARFSTASAMVSALIKALSISDYVQRLSSRSDNDSTMRVVGGQLDQTGPPLCGGSTPSSRLASDAQALNDSKSPVLKDGSAVPQAPSKTGDAAQVPGTREEQPVNFATQALGASVLSASDPTASRVVTQMAPDVRTPDRPRPKPEVGWHITPVRSHQRFWASLLSCVLVVVILASGFTAFFWSQRASTPVQAQSNFGNAFFVSSGLLDQNSTNGIVDGVQIALHNISPPAPGKNYYAWLLADNDAIPDEPPIRLGTLSVVNGQAIKTYNDAHASDLLAHYSRFLVTEEDASTPPENPSLDQATWRYAAVFSRVPNPDDTANHFSLLAHLRHLLAADPKLHKVGLAGGLDIWLFRNTLKILEWAGSARDAYQVRDTGLVQRQLVRILDYLDGSQFIQTEHLPSSVPSMLVDPTIARVAMLEFSAEQNPPGYLKHIGNHLRELAQSPNATAEQKQLSTEINKAMGNVKGWLLGVHSDAVQLLQMSPEQLQQPQALALLDHMFVLANYAFVGQTDPNTNQVKEGVSQIHYKVQRLATFNVLTCNIADPHPCL